VSILNFLDPKLINGKPYGPERFKNIVQERYFISKKCNTSYNDVGEMTPIERKYIIGFILDEIEKEKQLIDEVKQKQETRRGKWRA